MVFSCFFFDAIFVVSNKTDIWSFKDVGNVFGGFAHIKRLLIHWEADPALGAWGAPYLLEH